MSNGNRIEFEGHLRVSAPMQRWLAKLVSPPAERFHTAAEALAALPGAAGLARRARSRDGSRSPIPSRPRVCGSAIDPERDSALWPRAGGLGALAVTGLAIALLALRVRPGSRVPLTEPPVSVVETPQQSYGDWIRPPFEPTWTSAGASFIGVWPARRSHRAWWRSPGISSRVGRRARPPSTMPFARVRSPTASRVRCRAGPLPSIRASRCRFGSTCARGGEDGLVPCTARWSNTVPVVERVRANQAADGAHVSAALQPRAGAAIAVDRGGAAREGVGGCVIGQAD